MKAILELEMPDSCSECQFRGLMNKPGASYCYLLNMAHGYELDRSRHPHCPLKTLPEGQPVTDCNRLEPDLDTPEGLRAAIVAILKTAPIKPEFEGEIMRLGKENASLKRHHDHLKSENLRLQKENAGLGAVNSKLHGRIKEIKEDFDKLKSKNDQNMRDLVQDIGDQVYRFVLDQLKNSDDELVAVNEALRKMYHEKTAENDALKKQYAEVAAENEKLIAQTIGQQEAWEEADEEVKRLKAENEKLITHHWHWWLARQQKGDELRNSGEAVAE